MAGEELNFDQIKLISSVNSLIPPHWRITHEIKSGKLSIYVFYGLGGLFGGNYPIAEITFDQTNNCLLLHFVDNRTNTEIILLQNSLREATDLQIYNI